MGYLCPLPETDRLADSAEGGSTIIYHNRQLADVPGFLRVEARQKELDSVHKRMLRLTGMVSVSTDILNALRISGVRDEHFGEHGLRHIRKKGQGETVYFIAHLAANRIIWMDSQKIPWNRIYFMDITYSDFNASGWIPMDSGLLGPVKLGFGN